MDNTVKTNKNTFVNAFFRELISRNKLRSAQLSFCIRRHTKESINMEYLTFLKFQPDVLFANVSHTYKHRDVFTLHQMKLIYDIYSKCSHMTSNNMWDYKSWLEQAETIERITMYQHFKMVQGLPLRNISIESHLKLLAEARYIPLITCISYRISEMNRVDHFFNENQLSMSNLLF
jgi:hypothetical protein